MTKWLIFRNESIGTFSCSWTNKQHWRTLNRYRRGLEICPQAKTSKSGHIFFFFFRRVRATSMTQHRVENTRVHFKTFSPVSVKVFLRSRFLTWITLFRVNGTMKNLLLISRTFSVILQTLNGPFRLHLILSLDKQKWSILTRFDPLRKFIYVSQIEFAIFNPKRIKK